MAQVPPYGIPEVDPAKLSPSSPFELIDYGRNLEVVTDSGGRYESKFTLTHFPDSLVRIIAVYWNGKKPFNYYFVARNGIYYRSNKRGRLRRKWYPGWVDELRSDRHDTTMIGDTTRIVHTSNWRGLQDSTYMRTDLTLVRGRLIGTHHFEPTSWDSYTSYTYDGDQRIHVTDSAKGPLSEIYSVEWNYYDLEMNGAGQVIRVDHRRSWSYRTDVIRITTELTWKNGVCVEETLNFDGTVTKDRLRFLP